MQPKDLAKTQWQTKLMIDILKTYMSLRKSHFYTCEGGLKREKISDELIVISGWLEELEKEE